VRQTDFAVTHCISEAAILVFNKRKSINIKSAKSVTSVLVKLLQVGTYMYAIAICNVDCIDTYSKLGGHSRLIDIFHLIYDNCNCNYINPRKLRKL